MNLQQVAASIQKISAEHQTPVYIVGGFVRDFLLGIVKQKDIDCVVVGSGIDFAKKFDAAMQATVPVEVPAIKVGSLVEFPDFDTARYIFAAAENRAEAQFIIEFAGARSESYAKTSRKPQVVAASLEEDLKRRDFTVNAMAIPVGLFAAKKAPTLAAFKKQLVDPFNGIKDLKEQVLRTPLEPSMTFSDDPLRMLRAVRFAAQLGFGIEKSALEAMYTNRNRLAIISGERVQEELLKLMAAPQPSIGLQLMFQTHIMDSVLPEVAALDGVEEIFGHQHKNNLVHSFKVVDNIAQWSPKPELRLAGLLHDIGKPGTKKFMGKIGWTFHAHEHLGKKLVFGIAKRLKFSKELTQYLAKLIRWHMQPIALMDEGITDSAVRRLVVTMGDLLDDLLTLGRGDITTGNPLKKEKRLKNYDHLTAKIAEVLEKDKLRAFQSPLRGDEIMVLTGLKPGPTVGKIKEAIEEAILDGKIPNEYAAAKAYFETIKGSYIGSAGEWEKSV